MQIVKQNAPLTPSQGEEIVIKAKLLDTLKGLQDQPSSLGLKILKALLPKDLTLVEPRLQYSEKGHYWWLLLGSNPLFECGLCFWAPGSSSLRHDHYDSIAIVVPLHGAIEHTLYHVSHNKFFVFSKEESRQLWPFFVDKWQLHQVRNVSSDWAISLHCYSWRRPFLELLTED
ncbi:MAG: Cysteine dioxygenase type [Cyanobacteriota bacterium]|jgi:predicted metal-dependent enzyme (double-stranded beta helix superfamily)